MIIEELSQDEKKQYDTIKEMATKTRTFLLKKGYKNLSKKPHRNKNDEIAFIVIKQELQNRGKL